MLTGLALPIQPSITKYLPDVDAITSRQKNLPRRTRRWCSSPIILGPSARNYPTAIEGAGSVHAFLSLSVIFALGRLGCRTGLAQSARRSHRVWLKRTAREYSGEGMREEGGRKQRNFDQK